jgi:hypothetical protein
MEEISRLFETFGNMFGKCSSNRLPKFAQLSVTVICKLAMSTIPSQGIYRGNRSCLYLFCNSLPFQIWQLTACMLVINVGHPCQRNKPPGGGEPSNYVLQTNEHLHFKAREFKPCMKERHVRPLHI